MTEEEVRSAYKHPDDTKEIEDLLAKIKKENPDDLITNPYNDGHLYVGQTRGNIKHGIGEFFWPGRKRARFIGEYREDHRNGLGKMEHADGSVYDGFWLNDKKNGRGKFKF